MADRHSTLLSEVRNLVAEGVAEADRGELLDGEAVMAELFRKHVKKAAEAATTPSPKRRSASGP